MIEWSIIWLNHGNIIGYRMILGTNKNLLVIIINFVGSFFCLEIQESERRTNMKRNCYKIKEEFLSTYNRTEYLTKPGRPFYVSLSVNEIYVAIVPLRTNIKHKYGFIIRTNQSQKSGLDFTKSILLKRSDLPQIIERKAWLKANEYHEIKRNEAKIEVKFKKFIEIYKDIVEKSEAKLAITRAEENLLQYTTLKSFHSILQIMVI